MGSAFPTRCHALGCRCVPLCCRWCPAGGDPRPLGPRAGTGGPDPAWSTGTGSCPREGREHGGNTGSITQNGQDVPTVVP